MSANKVQHEFSENIYLYGIMSESEFERGGDLAQQSVKCNYKPCLQYNKDNRLKYVDNTVEITRIMISLGKMLKCFRKEKELAIKQMCTGICSVPLVTQFEKGESTPDVLLFERFMERMGTSVEDFAIMATENEYAYYLWRDEIYAAIEAKKWQEVSWLLQESAVMQENCNRQIVLQFIHYVKGIQKAAEKEGWNEAAEHLKYAIMQTNPDMFQMLDTDLLLSASEVHLLMLYLYYGVQGKLFDRETGKMLFYKLENYIYNSRLEVTEQAKIYPKLVCIGIHLFESQIDFIEKIVLCRKAIELLRSTETFYDITELLGLYIPLLRMIKSEEVIFYEKQYEVFCQLLGRSGANVEFRPECIVLGKPKVYVIKEYLYSKRKEKGFTQEKISEDICEPRSYSRIEQGETKPFPRKLHALSKKLDISWCHYRGELETDIPEAYRLRKKHRKAAIKKRWEEDLEILKEMENLLDMDKIVNYQYVKSKEYMVEYYMGKVSAEEVYPKLEELLKSTRIIDMETEYLVYYSQTEVEIVANMAKLLRAQKRYEEGIKLIETVLRQMSRSTVSFEYQWNGVGFAIRILSDLYFSIGKYEWSAELMEYVYKIEIKLRSG